VDAGAPAREKSERRSVRRRCSRWEMAPESWWGAAVHTIARLFRPCDMRALFDSMA